MSAWLDKIKNDLLEKHRMQKLVEPEKYRQEIEQTAKGIDGIPVAQFIKHIQYIESELMPAVEKRRGKDSADYKFFDELCRSLMWCIILCDRHDHLQRINTGYRMENAILRENSRLLETELQKYCTVEEILFTDFLDRYAETIKSRAEGLLKGRKPL